MAKNKNNRTGADSKTVILAVLLVLLVGFGGLVYSVFRKPKGFSRKIPSEQREIDQESQTINTREEITPAPSERKTLPSTQEKSPFSLSIFNPEDGLKLSTNQVIVRGKTVAGAEVFVNELETKADSQGNFSVRLTLEEGENPLVISAGNENGDIEVERTVYYEKE